MILVDSSVWIDHLRAGEPTLADLLSKRQVLTHPFVVGELALGSLRQRDVVIASLQDLSEAVVAYDEEVMQFITQQNLFGLGIGYIDAHLLVAVRLTPGALLWTRDKRLNGLAQRFSVAFAAE
ncbi:hypothetical protein FBZ89_107184 [Nitrospirillum amazonense]|uniref:PIN domain-containing protein n=1 Tax=Nitrospirillum amazonense TaxID=28077 RepID=A0A560FFT6_9PROT|nr:PIN domain-containing protein [Nitrospirillum amazonense]TWB20473.1 hypothetical protein FBZ89_107184 [Nitrospirillum amazonense]